MWIRGGFKRYKLQQVPDPGPDSRPGSSNLTEILCYDLDVVSALHVKLALVEERSG